MYQARVGRGPTGISAGGGHWTRTAARRPLGAVRPGRWQVVGRLIRHVRLDDLEEVPRRPLHLAQAGRDRRQIGHADVRRALRAAEFGGQETRGLFGRPGVRNARTAGFFDQQSHIDGLTAERSRVVERPWQIPPISPVDNLP